MDETVRVIHKRELSESNAPLRPQTMTPDMAAYIQAPGVGHYLKNDIVNDIVVFFFSLGTSDSVKLLTEQLLRTYLCV